MIHECVSFGYVLFAHGCEWRFVFDAGDGSGDGCGKGHGMDGVGDGDGDEISGTRLLVLPGLEKLSDGKGEVYEVPRAVVEGESVVV